MRRLTPTVRTGRVIGELRHCSGSSTTASSSTAPQNSRYDFNARDGTTSQEAPLTSRKPAQHQQHLHTAFDEDGDIAGRMAAGRSPHLNAAYQKTRHRVGGSSAQGEPRQRQRQRAGPRQSTRQHTTAFAADTETADARAYETGSSTRTGLPMVHPGADLPPLRQGGLTEKRVGKFSFVSDPSERASRDFYGHDVPNNTPKPKLPMWASSLTSPALGKVRLVEETWVSPHVRGTIDSAATSEFVTWLADTVLPADAVLRDQLMRNIVLDLRKTTARGVYAKKAFSKGEVVLTIPLSTVSSASAERTIRNVEYLTLNSETLAAHLTGARARPGLPHYEEIKKVLSVRRSSFDPIPHPVFIDQVHAALLLACEKADGLSSPLHPYIQLLQKGELFDDERIKELHLGVLDPQTHMEYTEHRNRFQHYLRELHKTWWRSYESVVQAHRGQVKTLPDVAVTSAVSTTSPSFLNVALPLDPKGDVGAAERAVGDGARDMITQLTVDAGKRTDADVAKDTLPSSFRPPPSLEDVTWAFRVVLSRQNVLPHLRVQRDAFERIPRESVEGEELDSFARALMKLKYAFYQHLLRAVDEDRLHVNEVDPSSIPTIVPLLDMLHHPPSGIGNVVYTVEEVTQETVKDDTGDNTFDRATASITADRGRCRLYQVVLRAAADIDADEELTVAYTKCYSVAYTLYRYGFLALRRREDDNAALLAANRVDGTFQPTRGASDGAEVPLLKRWWTSWVGKS